ncbi:tetratricopeptide repeat protein [Flavobacterium sp. C3NV]|uniref:tetratricopeptide repeat protein n=1 Tax=Flavobacterium sp. C3NV TaxID=3393358 RepID=UPI00398F9E34
MKKEVFLLLTFLTCNFIFSQNYMAGQKRYCETNDAKILELYDLGFRTLQYKKYQNVSTRIFLDIVKKDSTQCDAYFWAGYTLRLQNKYDLAIGCYYMADSLANNKSIEFKQNLAMTSLMLGKVDLARKKYSEMITFFPDNPEGYYGFALTAPMIGDVDKGLENIKISIEKYGKRDSEIKNQTELLYGILLTLNKNYTEAVLHFEECASKFKNDDNFNIHYSLSLIKIAEQNNDEDGKKKGLKVYNKIKNKEEIPKALKGEFNFKT